LCQLAGGSRRACGIYVRAAGVALNFEIADVHTWRYPEPSFDVICDIFTQFSLPAQRAQKWARIKKTLKMGRAFDSARLHAQTT
jgi:hypothetical protein